MAYYEATVLDDELFLESKNSNYKCYFKREGINFIKKIDKDLESYIKIKTKFSLIPLKLFYEITLENSNERLKIFYKGFLKPQYLLKKDSTSYIVYSHRGRKYSIFNDENQIAYFEIKAISSYTKDIYEIHCNENVDIEIILIFICSIDFRFDDDYSTAKVNLGNIGLEAKKFDENWTPS